MEGEKLYFFGDVIFSIDVCGFIPFDFLLSLCDWYVG